jgi:hypothetical protein
MSDIAFDPTSARRFRLKRRRFLAVAVVGMAALAVAMGVSFTADSGSTTVSVTAGSTSPLVFTGTLSGDISKYKVSGGTSRTAPNWTPVSGSAGSVTTVGDLAIIDARSASAGGATNLTITIYVTNLPALQKMYSSFAWPIRLYSGKYTATGTVTDWSGAAIVASSDTTYLTNTGGYLSFSVPTAADDTLGNIVAVQLGGDGGSDGGSFYTVSTTAAGGSLNPTFFITAQPS